MFIVVVPWSHLPDDQAQGRAAYLRIGKNCVNGCKGETLYFSFLFDALSTRSSLCWSSTNTRDEHAMIA